MKYLAYLLTFCLSGMLVIPGQAQLNKTIGKVLNSGGSQSGGNLAESDIVSGLKEALKVGIQNGAGKASSLDGYLKNEAIKLLLPPEIQKAEATLRKIGLGDQVDKFVVSLNRSAEDAAKKAVPVFASAITSMTITDALGILKGPDSAATAYLKRTTNQELYKAFYPVVDSALNQNDATKYYTELVTAYNKVPLVKKINPDLKQYATQKAMDGLYLLVADEEKKIRENPAARVSTVLQKVFGN